MEEDLIYSLNTQDVQNVADEVLNRSLTKEEIDLVKESVEESINWFDIIEMAILERIKISNEDV